eukprot:gene17117-56987_t
MAREGEPADERDRKRRVVPFMAVLIVYLTFTTYRQVKLLVEWIQAGGGDAKHSTRGLPGAPVWPPTKMSRFPRPPAMNYAGGALLYSVLVVVFARMFATRRFPVGLLHV